MPSTRRDRLPPGYENYRDLLNPPTDAATTPARSTGRYITIPGVSAGDITWTDNTTFTWATTSTSPYTIVEDVDEHDEDQYEEPCTCHDCVYARERANNAEAHTCGACAFNPADYGYRDWITWVEEDGQWFCSDCCVSCRQGCGNISRHGFRDRYGYCDTCTVHCYQCGTDVPDIEDTENAFIWNNGSNRRRTTNASIYCMECTFICSNCNARHPSGNQVYVENIDGDCCNTCAQYCGTCGNYTIGRCECQADHIRGYGETVPTRWLGGPLKHDDSGNDVGYYVGFELEISARENPATGRMSARPVREWSNEHLGYNDIFDCKYDGSVRGFEIATQPMTPHYFESVDWESFMDMLNNAYPLRNTSGNEPREHGLHVHIGRVAFKKDPVAQAAYAYLLGQGNHLERIARRRPYHYCAKVEKPVSASIAQSKPGSKQGMRIRGSGIGYGRDAINLTNNKTIEIRAFRSTRSANELRDAVRITYLSAEYVRELRQGGWKSTSTAMHWSEFSAWVGAKYPEAFASISGIAHQGSNKFETAPEFWA